MRDAKSIMTRNPKCIGSGELLIDTINVFFKNNIHYAPVITPADEVLGLLSETALVKAALRHHLDAGKNEKVYAHRDLLEPVPYVNEDAKIEEVMKVMMKSSSKRVLVHDPRLKLIGIISPKDILRRLQGEYNLSKGMNFELKKAETTVADAEVKNLQQLVHVYKEAFENSPLLMHSVDGKGKIVMANRCIHKELGYEDNELIGRTMFDLYSHPVHEMAEQGLESIKKAGFHRSTATQMVRKDGHTVNVDIVSSALRDSNGVFLSTISVSRVIDSKELLTALLDFVGEE